MIVAAILPVVTAPIAALPAPGIALEHARHHVHQWARYLSGGPMESWSLSTTSTRRPGFVVEVSVSRPDLIGGADIHQAGR